MNKKTKITFEIDEEEKEYLDLCSKKLEMSVSEFCEKYVIMAIDAWEDEWDSSEIDKIINEIESGKRETISWKEAKKEYLA